MPAATMVRIDSVAPPRRRAAGFCATVALALLTACAASSPPKVDTRPVTIPPGAVESTRPGEPISWQIPNMPAAAEAYYGPDSRHLIAQVSSKLAMKSIHGSYGYLTTTFTDDGQEITLINDKGYDACSYFFPDGKRLIWTSVKDHLDMRLGNWSDWKDYPRGAELYVSDLKGKHVKRLTFNEYYEAEVTVSPNGKWIVFGRQIQGHMSIWRMRADGTGETKIFDDPALEPGAPYFLPDSETIIFRAWRGDEYGKISPTPMTIYTIHYDGTDLKPRTFTHDMNWAPYPTPDGKHFLFVRAETPKNWEVYLGSLDGVTPPKRITFDDGFDGFPSISPDGRKMVWTTNRSTPNAGFMQGLRLHVMDMTSFHLGPQYRDPPAAKP